MNLKHTIREWLGINELWRKLENQNSIILAISHRLGDVQSQIAEPLATLTSILYDEHSTVRKAASNRLGTETTKRLIAEAKARAPYDGQ